MPTNEEEEISVLRARLTELEARVRTPEDDLKLAVFNQIPFTIWAATKDHRIVLWNAYCSTNYGWKADEALGKDFVELFVDDLEAEDARKDCIAVIEKNVPFRNFLANDHTTDGHSRLMLTNCFRVFDKSRDTYLQVEVGIPAGELDWEFAKNNLRSLRDIATKRRQEQVELLNSHRTNLLELISLVHMRKSVPLTAKLQEISRAKLHSGAAATSDVQRLFQEKKKKVDDDFTRLHIWQRELLNEATAAKTSEEIQAISARIGGHP